MDQHSEGVRSKVTIGWRRKMSNITNMYVTLLMVQRRELNKIVNNITLAIMLLHQLDTQYVQQNIQYVQQNIQMLHGQTREQTSHILIV